MYILIFISHLPLDSTYPLQLTIKGEIKGLQFQGIKIDQFLQGVYIRNSTGLTNSKPSWTHESDSALAIWFDDASGKWQVGDSNFVFLRSSTSPDNSLPQEAKNWEYLDVNNLYVNYQLSEKYITSSNISIKRGM